MIRIIFTALSGFLLFSGCAKPDISGQTAEYSYRQMAWEIGRNNIDRAGDYYSSLASEHIGSTLLKEASLMMAMAHIKREEYLLANFYLDEYAKRFGSSAENDRAAFLKLLAEYGGIKLPMRDQKLLNDGISKSSLFIERFADSQLAIYAETIKTKTILALSELDENIADLYSRLGKEEAAAYHRKKGEFKPKSEGAYARSKTMWLRWIFE
ncbi:MAG: outer membrane protein assembly factor BamD [Helicobacteraceae bacterium]|jgi:outer membrane protein assembly factor BamD|nr:outer membrane protein assembly factor BamD [Helicobacteraceae bacterium]